jgi:uncharacterized protein YuzE
MRACCIEVTYRRGKALAAYLYLPRPDRPKSARTMEAGKGMLVDNDVRGAPIGIEITAPTIVRARDINLVLRDLRQPTLIAKEWPFGRAA